MQKQLITFMLNHEKVAVEYDPAASLLSLLREELGLYGTKAGCKRGECGSCTVLVNKKAVNSCLFPAGKAEGLAIETIEGQASGFDLSPVQDAFLKKGAVQCGFCTPGMIMSATALLKENRTPKRRQIKEALSGNICRCGGYIQIEEAVKTAAETIAQESSNAPHKERD